MSYVPIIPASGYAGWKMLNRTMTLQKAAFVASAEIQRDEAYFREKIASVTTAEDLVSDRRLLKVALGAFGLDSDINNKFFIQKVLDEGTLDSTSLANKLSDKTYLKLSQAFGFGDFSTPRTVLSDFADEILAQYEARQFEVAVGESDDTFRLALAAQRELPELAEKSSSETTKWYTVIGSKSLSSVMRTALGLPDSVASLDVDQQLKIFRQKSDDVLGSPDVSGLGEPETLEKVIRLFLVRSQIDTGGSVSSASAALQLLSASSYSSGSSSLSLLL